MLVWLRQINEINNIDSYSKPHLSVYICIYPVFDILQIPTIDRIDVDGMVDNETILLSKTLNRQYFINKIKRTCTS